MEIVQALCKTYPRRAREIVRTVCVVLPSQAFEIHLAMFIKFPGEITLGSSQRSGSSDGALEIFKFFPQEERDRLRLED